MIFDLAVAMCVLYVLLQLIFPTALLRIRRSFRLDDAALPTVSVLVSCKNEARDLPRCLAALAALDYPRERLQVLLVDDASSDDTLPLLQAACAEHAHFQLFETRLSGSPRLRGKARGIALAATHATGEWLFITDADCTMRPNWLRHMLSGADVDTGLIGGAIAVEPTGLVGAVECAAGCYVMPFALGVHGLGLKAIVSGPNMAIRRDLYEAAGGLEGSGMRVAEDMAFERMVHAAGKRTLVYADPESTTIARPVPSFTHLFSQQRRWLIGGIEGDKTMYGIVLLMLGVLAVFYVSLVLASFAQPQSVLPLWGAVLLGNLYGTWAFGRAVGMSLSWLSPVLLVHQVCIWPWLYVSTLLLRRIRWRGEAYVLSYDD